MEKLTSLGVVIMLIIFLGITSGAEARTGNTSDGSSKSRTTATSKFSTSSSSKSTSATDSIFANIAKTNEAKKAWQERNKKPVAPPVASVPDNNATRRQEQQLNAIQKQIADAKRQQQIIAAAQTAAQIALNNNKRPTVTPAPVMPMPPVSNLPNAPVNTVITQPEPAKSGGTSWFMIFLVLGGLVFVIIWFKKRNASHTIYRL